MAKPLLNQSATPVGQVGNMAVEFRLSETNIHANHYIISPAREISVTLDFITIWPIQSHTIAKHMHPLPRT